VIAPRLIVHHRDVAYPLVRQSAAWVIQIAGAEYFLTAGNDPTLTARQFLRDRMRDVSGVDLHRPSLIASQRYPLILSIDGIIVRAWPAFIPRDRPGWSTTYVNPATGHRVLATDGPVWMFAARGLESSPGGTTYYEQTVADVIDLAKIWLRSGLSGSGT
jgi:hypothetical protein